MGILFAFKWAVLFHALRMLTVWELNFFNFAMRERDVQTANAEKKRKS